MIQKVLCIDNMSILEELPFVMGNNSDSPESNNADIYIRLSFYHGITKDINVISYQFNFRMHVDVITNLGTVTHPSNKYNHRLDK